MFRPYAAFETRAQHVGRPPIPGVSTGYAQAMPLGSQPQSWGLHLQLFKPIWEVELLDLMRGPRHG